MTLRSVNHRGLDLHFHPSGALAQFENAVRTVLKKRIARGHIEIRLLLVADAESEAINYNRDLLKRYVTLFRRACTEFELESTPDLNTLFALPGVFDAARETQTIGSNFESEVIAAVTACVDELNAFREREGRELCCSLESEIAAIQEQVAQMRLIRAQAVPQFLERLRERLADLLHDSGISEKRLVAEAALLADRSDVQEELARLTVHTQELRCILHSGGEVGKRVDFLLQEMNRETNTVLAKTSGIGDAGLTMTNLALATKANIERMREQALNLE